MAAAATTTTLLLPSRPPSACAATLMLLPAPSPSARAATTTLLLSTPPPSAPMTLLRPSPPPSARAALERKKKDWIDSKPGRASSSSSWNADKLRARTSASVPGRASLSADWNKDKIDVKGLSRMDRKRSPSRAPPAERFEKRAKLYFAGPGFVESPDPSELPIPRFLEPSGLPTPRFLLKAPTLASSSDCINRAFFQTRMSKPTIVLLQVKAPYVLR